MNKGGTSTTFLLIIFGYKNGFFLFYTSFRGENYMKKLILLAGLIGITCTEATQQLNINSISVEEAKRFREAVRTNMSEPTFDRVMNHISGHTSQTTLSDMNELHAAIQKVVSCEIHKEMAPFFETYNSGITYYGNTGIKNFCDLWKQITKRANQKQLTVKISNDNENENTGSHISLPEARLISADFSKELTNDLIQIDIPSQLQDLQKKLETPVIKSAVNNLPYLKEALEKLQSLQDENEIRTHLYALQIVINNIQAKEFNPHVLFYFDTKSKCEDFDGETKIAGKLSLNGVIAENRNDSKLIKSALVLSHNPNIQLNRSALASFQTIPLDLFIFFKTICMNEESIDVEALKIALKSVDCSDKEKTNMYVEKLERIRRANWAMIACRFLKMKLKYGDDIPDDLYKLALVPDQLSRTVYTDDEDADYGKNEREINLCLSQLYNGNIELAYDAIRSLSDVDTMGYASCLDGNVKLLVLHNRTLNFDNGVIVFPPLLKTLMLSDEDLRQSENVWYFGKDVNNDGIFKQLLEKYRNEEPETEIRNTNECWSKIFINAINVIFGQNYPDIYSVYSAIESRHQIPENRWNEPAFSNIPRQNSTFEYNIHDVVEGKHSLKKQILIAYANLFNTDDYEPTFRCRGGITGSEFDSDSIEYLFRALLGHIKKYESLIKNEPKLNNINFVDSWMDVITDYNVPERLKSVLQEAQQAADDAENSLANPDVNSTLQKAEIVLKKISLAASIAKDMNIDSEVIASIDHALEKATNSIEEIRGKSRLQEIICNVMACLVQGFCNCSTGRNEAVKEALHILIKAEDKEIPLTSALGESCTLCCEHVVNSLFRFISPTANRKYPIERIKNEITGLEYWGIKFDNIVSSANSISAEVSETSFLTEECMYRKHIYWLMNEAYGVDKVTDDEVFWMGEEGFNNFYLYVLSHLQDQYVSRALNLLYENPKTKAFGMRVDTGEIGENFYKWSSIKFKTDPNTEQETNELEDSFKPIFNDGEKEFKEVRQNKIAPSRSSFRHQSMEKRSAEIFLTMIEGIMNDTNGVLTEIIQHGILWNKIKDDFYAKYSEFPNFERMLSYCSVSERDDQEKALSERFLFHLMYESGLLTTNPSEFRYEEQNAINRREREGNSLHRTILESVDFVNFIAGLLGNLTVLGDHADSNSDAEDIDFEESGGTHSEDENLSSDGEGTPVAIEFTIVPPERQDDENTDLVSESLNTGASNEESIRSDTNPLENNGQHDAENRSSIPNESSDTETHRNENSPTRTSNNRRNHGHTTIRLSAGDMINILNMIAEEEEDSSEEEFGYMDMDDYVYSDGDAIDRAHMNNIDTTIYARRTQNLSGEDTPDMQEDISELSFGDRSDDSYSSAEDESPEIASWSELPHFSQQIRATGHVENIVYSDIPTNELRQLSRLRNDELLRLLQLPTGVLRRILSMSGNELQRFLRLSNRQQVRFLRNFFAFQIHQ